MAPFLEAQIDYIYFFYGLAFLLLAQVCFSMEKPKGAHLSWALLGFFGVFHGTHEWLELIANNVGDSRSFLAGRVFMAAASFSFLVEFGRTGTVRLRGKGPGLIVFLLLLPLAASGAVTGWAGVSATSRYFLGFVGGIWAAYALFLESHRQGAEGRGWLTAMAVSLSLYAIATGVFVSPAPFYPASIINSHFFAKAFLLPVQLVRGLLALSATVALTGYYRTQCRINAQKENVPVKPPCTFAPLFTVLTILVAGWFATQYAGIKDERIGRNNSLARALLAASAVNPGRVERLTGAQSDMSSPDYVRLKEQLRAVCRANCESNRDCRHVYCRQIYIRGLRGGRMRRLVGVEAQGFEHAALPYGEAVDTLTAREMEDYESGAAALSGIRTGADGAWVNAAVPIRDFKTGKVAGQLVMDMEAGDWKSSVAVDRLFCIATTLVTSLLSMAIFVAWRRTRESEEHGAALKLAAVRLENEKSLREITSALGEGVIVLGENGRTTFMNPEAERLLGWSEADLKGRDAHDVLHLYKPDGTAASREGCPSLKTLITGKTFRSDTEVFTRKDGTNLPVSIVSSPIIDEGRIAGAVLAFQDNTERKNLERQREDFFAMVTHDLKSPLTAIMGYTEIILSDFKDSLEENTRDMVSSIRQSSLKVFRIVEDFLAVSRLETGSISLKESLVDIPELLAEVYDEFVPAAQNKGLSLEKTIPPLLPRVLMDRTFVYRAVSNLLQNAVNYTPKGGRVKLSAGRIDEDGADFIAISVDDNGIGISAAEKDKVFQKYYRSEKTAGIKGSGLGLSVVKAVAEAHGGRVELESAEGKGSAFRLFIPTNRG